jgi:outer membrane protein TolC
MLAAQGQPANFPQIDDEHISFLRPREQDTRITARQPIFAPGLAANVRAQHALYRASQSERVALARELKRDITVAYLNWLRANRAKDIVAASKSLLAENLRVTQAMFDNGKVTQDRVLRARAEMLNVEQQLRDAENAQTQAQSYCNFLLNRPLDTALEHGEVPSELRSPAFDLANLQHDAFDNRPELEQLARAAEAAREQTSAARSAYLPTLSLGIDAGTQGENYGFGPDYNFSTASLVLTWNIYSGGATEARVAGARAAQRQAVVQQSETAQRVALQVQQALDSYRTSVDSVATATARAEAAQAAFRIASRKRDEGALSQVEFIDARTELTNAELNLNLTRFDVLARHADLDYATANGSVPLP